LLGFSEEELEALLVNDGDGKKRLTNEEEAPEASEQPVSRRGDLWLLGSHKLLCGDATSAEDVATLLGAELADMVFTDPPYNVD